ncbi:MAG: succinylglutamate desuccinylase/aspartoacylase family protein [Candidatus Sumerlaeia bacterium]|nr:succinylglutamate desuccinylase/aspartoacylase family protein [Candidatus Sumerlaeia bacterium]
MFARRLPIDPRNRVHSRFRGFIFSVPVLLAASFLTPSSTIAQPTEQRPSVAAAVDRQQGDNLLEQLTKERWDITDVFDEEIHLYLSQEEFDRLGEMGHSVRWLEDHTVEWVEWLEKPDALREKSQFSYPTFQEMTDQLNDWVDEFPGLIQVESVGQSVQGRELWFARITGPDNEGPDFRPVVSHVATMHGDEMAGTPLAMDFIERLLAGYGEDEEITWLVNNTEIWVMPLMNPDGYADGIAPNSRRSNANNIDLNRNFPSWACGDQDTTSGRQPETVAIMEWSAARNQVVLQANYHGGALVINYPLDECATCNTQCGGSYSADEPLLREIALAWARPNQRLSNSTRFTDGVTNGAEWYSIYGSMQDWHFRFRGTVEVTVELDNNKIPGSTLLEQIVLENRQSTIDYTMWGHQGLRGYVINNHGDGVPVAATVSVEGTEFNVRTDPVTGGFHRPLLPGTYSVMIQPEDTDDVYTFRNVVVNEGIATPRTFALHGTGYLDVWMIY